MCGRVACSLCSDDVSMACSYPKKYTNSEGYHYVKPQFLEESVYKYSPSYNLCPSQVIPVLLHKSHIQGVTSESDYVIIPMRWGLLPHFEMNTSTTLHNARIENINHSTVFKPELNKNHRCVVLCDGYFEWNTIKKDKQPYFVSQERIKSPNDSASGDVNDFLGRPVMKLAGIFSVHRDDEGNTKYSCAIITTEADSTLNWLHHRMPICLQTLEDVDRWINCKKGLDSLKFLHAFSENTSNRETPIYKIKHHAVSKKFVNDVHYKGEECIAPITHKRQMTLDSWCGSKRGPAASK